MQTAGPLTLSLPSHLQTTRRFRSCTASVTVLPPDSSHWSGLCCSCRCCYCKLSEGGCFTGLRIGTGPRSREKHPKAPALGITPTTCSSCHPEASEGSGLRVSTQRSSTSLTVPFLPPLQRDGERRGGGPFPAIFTFKPKKQVVRAWTI